MTIFYHAEITRLGAATEWMFDMDPYGLTKHLLLPLYTNGEIVLDGRPRPVTEVYGCHIIMTDYEVTPKLQEYASRQSIKSGHIRSEFVREQQLFLVERDVSNALLHEFKESLSLRHVKELLEAQRQLKEDLAANPQSESTAEAKGRLAALSADIAYIFGSFLAGYLKDRP